MGAPPAARGSCFVVAALVVVACRPPEPSTPTTASAGPARGTVFTDEERPDAAECLAGAAAGDVCVPVARCQIFPATPNTPCALIRANSDIEVSAELAKIVAGPYLFEQGCPGDPGTSEHLAKCLAFVETQLSCTYRPTLRDPGYGCALVDGACERTSAAP